MTWSWRIGRLLGVKIYVHVTFVLLVGFMVLAEYLTAGATAASFSLVLLLSLFACVLLHELGHAMAARGYGIPTRDITLLPIGGLARLERMPEEPVQEMVISLAGPVVNMVIAFGLAWYLAMSNTLGSLTGLHWGGSSLVAWILVANVMLAVFNLLPAFPTDGGRVLRALLCFWMNRSRATQIAARVGQAMAFFFGLVGLLTWSPILVLIALFIWYSAGTEAAAVQVREAMRGIPLATAVLRDFRVLHRDHRLADAAHYVIEGFQHDFPVMENDRPVGLLTRERLVAALARSGPQSRVGDAMLTEFPRAEESDTVQSVMGRMSALGSQTALVMRGGQLVGLVTRENIGELVLLHSAIEQSLPTPPPEPWSRPAAAQAD